MKRKKFVQGLPLEGDGRTAALYALVLGCMGLLISWAAPACNNPIFAEIVPPHLRSMIYAFDRSFETAIAASAAPVVGLLAENVFGWQVQIELSGRAKLAATKVTEIKRVEHRNQLYLAFLELQPEICDPHCSCNPCECIMEQHLI